MPREYRVFVYGAAMRGEPRHGVLEGATFVGEALTAPSFDLVDLGADAALVLGGRTAIAGEVYSVAVETLAALDREAGHPILFRRLAIPLQSGDTAEAYVLEADQARGRRRIRAGNWRTRAERARTTDGGPLVRWARGRHRTR